MLASHLHSLKDCVYNLGRSMEALVGVVLVSYCCFFIVVSYCLDGTDLTLNQLTQGALQLGKCVFFDISAQ